MPLISRRRGALTRRRRSRSDRLPDARTPLVLIAEMDGEVTEPELRADASALGVDEPRLKSLHQILHGHTRLVYLDVWRRSAMLRTSGFAR